MRFTGTDAYVATDDLMTAVNAAVTLERPLLVKGEPGTGKTQLAREIAQAMNAPFIDWAIKSTTKAQHGLYEYDAVSRLRDSQLGDARVKDIGNYIIKGKLWEAFESEQRPVLLIDEIDKADIEFPNDLLRELDQMEFYVHELRRTVRAQVPPVTVLTSNRTRELNDAASASHIVLADGVDFAPSAHVWSVFPDSPPQDRRQRALRTARFPHVFRRANTVRQPARRFFQLAARSESSE